MDIKAIREAKRNTREKYKAIRNEISVSDRALFSEKICGHLLGLFSYKYCKKILVYYPIKDEVDILTFISKALSEGKEVYFPKTYEKGLMKFYKVSELSELVPGKFGVSEPCGGKEYVNEDTPALCIVPGLCFDKKGYRIGYGKGFYDRFLKEFSGISVGVTFSACTTEALIIEKRYDRPCDFTVTELGVSEIVS